MHLNMNPTKCCLQTGEYEHLKSKKLIRNAKIDLKITIKKYTMIQLATLTKVKKGASNLPYLFLPKRKFYSLTNQRQ